MKNTTFKDGKWKTFSITYSTLYHFINTLLFYFYDFSFLFFSFFSFHLSSLAWPVTSPDGGWRPTTGDRPQPRAISSSTPGRRGFA